MFAAETRKSRFLRASNVDGSCYSRIGNASQVFMELFTWFDRKNVIRESDGVLILASVGSSDDGKGWDAWFFAVCRIGCHCYLIRKGIGKKAELLSG